MVSFKCPNCGMLLQTKDADTSTSCTLCGETVKPPPEPEHSMEERGEAHVRRKHWRQLSLIITGAQLIVLTAGLAFPRYITFSPIPALLWVLLVAAGSAVISGLRPDDAYVEEPPRPKSRIVLFLSLLFNMLLGAAAIGGTVMLIMMLLG